MKILNNYNFSNSCILFSGMIYMEPSALGWDPLLKSWLQTTPEMFGDFLKTFMYESLFIRFCKPLFHLLRRGGIKEMCPMPDSNLLRSVTYLMDCFISDYHEPKPGETMKELDLRAQIEVLISSIIGTFDFNDRFFNLSL